MEKRTMLCDLCGKQVDQYVTVSAFLRPGGPLKIDPVPHHPIDPTTGGVMISGHSISRDLCKACARPVLSALYLSIPEAPPPAPPPVRKPSPRRRAKR
jgi:hypothetical protein